MAVRLALGAFDEPLHEHLKVSELRGLGITGHPGFVGCPIGIAAEILRWVHVLTAAIIANLLGADPIAGTRAELVVAGARERLAKLGGVADR